MVGIISIANALGRLLWAWLSDATGRRNVFLIMFLLQALLFFIMPSQREFAILVSLAFVVLSCYGGGFGTMPAFATDYFGPKSIGSIYGLMLTAWGFAAVFGPLLIARVRRSNRQLQRRAYNSSVDHACIRRAAVAGGWAPCGEGACACELGPTLVYRLLNPLGFVAFKMGRRQGARRAHI